MISIVLSKIVYLFIIALLCFIGGIAPITFKSWFGNKSLSYSSCLGAGILLGASFLHLLKDSNIQLDNSKFPISNLLFAIGFFASFILERVLFEHTHTPDHTIQHHHHHHDPYKKEDVVLSLFLDNEKESLVLSQDESTHSHDDRDKLEDKKKSKFPFMLFVVLSLESFVTGSALGVQNSELQLFITFLAIITHIWAEAFALSANVMKAMSKYKNNQEIKDIVYKSSIVFSSITPIGILFGLVSDSIFTQSQTNIFSGILLAFAGGCFLYVSVFEIMVEEFSQHEHNHIEDLEITPTQTSAPTTILFKIPIKWKKLTLILVGFVFMALLAIYV